MPRPSPPIRGGSQSDPGRVGDPTRRDSNPHPLGAGLTWQAGPTRARLSGVLSCPRGRVTWRRRAPSGPACQCLREWERVLGGKLLPGPSDPNYYFWDPKSLVFDPKINIFLIKQTLKLCSYGLVTLKLNKNLFRARKILKPSLLANLDVLDSMEPLFLAFKQVNYELLLFQVQCTINKDYVNNLKLMIIKLEDWYYHNPIMDD
jgi:hypothetical protein